MRLVQFLTSEGGRRVAVAEEDGLRLRIVGRVQSVYDLALEAIDAGSGLAALVETHLTEESIDYGIVRDEGRVLPPVDHPDPARWLITGTGLTHLGSASARDAMHAAADPDEPKSDSMRIFEWGVADGCLFPYQCMVTRWPNGQAGALGRFPFLPGQGCGRPGPVFRDPFNSA